MDNNETQNTLSIGDLWDIFISHIWIILIAGVLVFTLACGYKLVTYTPEYKSTATLYILRKDNEGTATNGTTISNSDFSLALSTVNDCTRLLTSRKVLERVIENLGMEISYERLKSMITVSNQTQTRILDVSVVAPSPMDAKIIVDQLCTVGAAGIMETLGISQVNIIDDGTYKETPSNSRLSAICLVAGLAAAVIVYGIYLVIYMFDDKISTPDDVEKYLGLSVLGLIPNAGGEGNGKYGQYGKYGKYSKYAKKY